MTAVEVFVAPERPPASWSAVLSAMEVDRIARLRRAEDRQRATAARALLRIAVAERLGCRPSEVEFSLRCAVCGGEHGKPVPVVPAGGEPVHASVSYSGSVVLVALAAVPVGLDVERVAATEFAGFDDVALSAAERRELREVAPAERLAVRAGLWTAKEAILKISGRGLSVAPATVHVGRNAVPGTVRVDAPVAAGGVVALAAVPVPGGYRACVAVEGADVPSVALRAVPRPAEAPAAAGRTTTA